MTFFLLFACSCKDAPIDSGPVVVDDSASPEWCPEIPHPDIPTDRWSATSTAPGGDLFTFDEAAGVIYAGSTMNGFYRSDDGGQTWDKKWADITHLAGQVAVDPEDPDRVAYTTGTLYWTLDGGETSQRSTLGDEPAGDIPRVRGVIYLDGFLALTEDGRLWEVEPEREAVLRGAITPAAQPPHGDDTSKFEPDASWWALAAGEGTLYAAQQGVGVYRSEDDGESWETADLGDVHVSTFGAAGDAVWVGGDGFVSLSEDRGDTWQIWEHNVEFRGLWFGDEGLVVADREQMWATNESGGLDALGPPDEEVHELRHLDALADGTLLMLHRDGVYLSSDGGDSWSPSAEGLEVVDLGPLLAHPTCAPLLWVGTQCERGLFESSEGWGDDLSYVDEYLHYVMVPRVSASRDLEIWVTTDDVLKRTTNLGASWEILGEDVLDVHQHGLDVHPTDGDIALSGTVGSGSDGGGDVRARIFRTTDDGATWDDVSDGIPDSEASIHAIHFVRSDPDVVLAGTYYGGDFVHRSDEAGFGMLRSADAGASWSPLSVDGVSNAPVFAECDGRLYAATDAGLLSSDDEGATWTNHKAPDSREFLTVACHGDVVLAMDYASIYRSDDRGQTWTDWSTGSDPGGWFNRMMPQLAISADGHMAYAAIPLIGLLRRPL